MMLPPCGFLFMRYRSMLSCRYSSRRSSVVIDPHGALRKQTTWRYGTNEVTCFDIVLLQTRFVCFPL